MKDISGAIMALISAIMFIGGTLIGFDLGLKSITSDCEKLGQFWKGDIVYSCRVSKP